MSDGQKNELIFEWTSWSDDDDDTEGNRSQFIMELGEEFSIADHKWHHFIFVVFNIYIYLLTITLFRAQ
jgi:hypothetical protein